MQACRFRSTARKPRRSPLKSATTEIDFDISQNNNGSFNHLLNTLSTKKYDVVERQLAGNGYVRFYIRLPETHVGLIPLFSGNCNSVETDTQHAYR